MFLLGIVSVIFESNIHIFLSHSKYEHHKNTRFNRFRLNMWNIMIVYMNGYIILTIQ